MANILITGGTGFIGVPLVKKLQSLEHNLKLLIRDTSDITPFQDLKNVEYVIGDVRDVETLYNATENIDLIYHLAAYTRMWAKDKSVFEDTNVKGIENIAQIALEKNLRLIYISSFIALGATPIEPVDERSTFNPLVKPDTSSDLNNNKVHDHLENIVYNVPKLYPITKRVILSILKDRWKKEKLSVIDIRLKVEKWKDEGYSVDEIEKMLESIGYEYG